MRDWGGFGPWTPSPGARFNCWPETADYATPPLAKTQVAPAVPRHAGARTTRARQAHPRHPAQPYPAREIDGHGGGALLPVLALAGIDFAGLGEPADHRPVA